jgi:hypothetical protein
MSGSSLSLVLVFPPTNPPTNPNPNPIVNVPDLSLGVTVADSTAGVVVSTDGGVQMNSALRDQYVIVDIFLLCDNLETPTAPSKQIAQRRVYVANVVDKQQSIGNWSFSIVDVRPPVGSYSYRVAAQIVATNTPVNAIAALVSAGPASAVSTVPHLRGTLTAVVINK